MSYETITNRLRDILLRIEGVENVHTFMRAFEKDDQIIEAFQKHDDETGLDFISGWMMTRTSQTSERNNLGTSILDVTHNIEITGFFSLYDSVESEKKFQEILDNITLEIKDKYQLEDSAGTELSGIIRVPSFDIVEISHAQLSSYLLHQCKIVLAVEERLQ